MSHALARSTELVATHCACCGRPLCDAVSVEVGVGPVCRERHGWASEPSDPNFDAAVLAIEGVEDQKISQALTDRDARRACNLAVHRVAADQLNGKNTALISMVRLLGFEALSDKLARQILKAKIVITEEGDRLRCSAPYSPTFVAAIRGIRGRRYEADKSNTVPRSQAYALLGALRTGYPAGTVVIGPNKIINL